MNSVGASLRLPLKGYFKQPPASRGSGFKAHPLISEDDQLYFAGSKGCRRSPGENPDGRTERKLSESRELRSQARGDSVTNNRRSLRQHQHVPPFHWSVVK
jgi:hypothetical protein